MPRRSTPKQTLAERRFPVRLRVFIPPGGLGSRLSDIHRWLNARYGEAGFFIGPVTAPGAPDGMAIYLPEVAGATELVARFDLTALIGNDDAAPS